MSDQGFIGETEARLQGILGGRQSREVRELRVVSSHPMKILYVL
jgi:hypothetical protein